MNQSKRESREKGSLSVESVLIFPLLFLGIIALIYIGILKYQNIAATAAVMQASSRAAASWSYIGGQDPAAFQQPAKAESLLKPEEFRNSDPYRFIWDSKLKQREANTEGYAIKLLADIVDINPNIEKQDVVKAKKQGFFLTPYIEVQLDRTYYNPLDRMLEQLGVQKEQHSIIQSRTALTSPVEFIRTVNLIEDYMYKHKVE